MFDPEKAADVLNVSFAFLERMDVDDDSEDNEADVEAAFRNIFDVAVEAVEAVVEWQIAFNQLDKLATATHRDLTEKFRRLSAAAFTSGFQVSAAGVAQATR